VYLLTFIMRRRPYYVVGALEIFSMMMMTRFYYCLASRPHIRLHPTSNDKSVSNAILLSPYLLGLPLCMNKRFNAAASLKSRCDHLRSVGLVSMSQKTTGTNVGRGNGTIVYAVDEIICQGPGQTQVMIAKQRLL